VLEGTMIIWFGGVKHVIAAGEEIVVAPHAVHEVTPETQTNFQAPNSNISSSAFGSITSTFPAR
jgi:hypothetical protein